RIAPLMPCQRLLRQLAEARHHGVEVTLDLDAHLRLVGALLAHHFDAVALRVHAQPTDMDRRVDRLLLQVGGEIEVDRAGQRHREAQARAHLVPSSWVMSRAMARRVRALPNVSSGMLTANSSSRDISRSSAAVESTQ